MLVLYQWIFAHLAGDFLLQSKKMVLHKKRLTYRSWTLYLHCLIHALLVYLFVPDKNAWYVPAVIFITHYCIDLWKLYQKENGLSFVIDQFLHLAVLITLWIVLYQPPHWLLTEILALARNKTFWLIATGYSFITLPLSFLLGYATQKWRKEAEQDIDRYAVSLSEAGKWIGMFERILVFTFVLTNHFEGIGFLIAAKSILRFNDIKGSNVRKEAEYILIGTLMSFASSILFALLITVLIKH